MFIISAVFIIVSRRQNHIIKNHFEHCLSGAKHRTFVIIKLTFSKGNFLYEDKFDYINSVTYLIKFVVSIAGFSYPKKRSHQTFILEAKL